MTGGVGARGGEGRGGRGGVELTPVLTVGWTSLTSLGALVALRGPVGKGRMTTERNRGGEEGTGEVCLFCVSGRVRRVRLLLEGGG